MSLPDPDAFPCDDVDVVIFDGHCAFCQSQVRRLHRWSAGAKPLAYLSLHDPRVAQRYPQLSHEALMQQMYVVSAEGTAYGGAVAVRYLSRRLPLLWWAVPVLHLPGSAGVWRWLYGQVAKRRYRLAGKTCDGDACRVHL